MWIERWKDLIDPEPVADGVWRRKDGGYHIRGRATDPRTNKVREVNRILADVSRAREASKILEDELAVIRSGVTDTNPAKLPSFAKYAADLLERKINDGSIQSAATRAHWEWALNSWLLDAVGPIALDQLRAADWEAFKAKVAPKVKSKSYSPTTFNDVLRIGRIITAKAAAEFEIRDSLAPVADFDKRTHRTYTPDAPNALPIEPKEVIAEFLDFVRVNHADHFAMVYVMLFTGLRPSTLRPLRIKGDDPDVRLEKSLMIVRRSQTVGDEVMEMTKTARDQRIHMPRPMVEVLRWHVDRLTKENAHRAKRFPLHAKAMEQSELLFPARPNKWNRGGGFLSANVLDDVFKAAGEALKLGYKITPRAMRRTYQDLARAAKVEGIVTRAISGHQTVEMQEHYSTVGAEEMRTGLAKIIDFATAKAKRKRAA